MNLQDRFNSGLPKSKPNEPRSISENCSLNSITESSTPQSPEQELLQKQSTALKSLSAERDHLLMNGRPEDQQEIQRLSSENSELKSLITELKTELSDTQTLNQTLMSSNQSLVQSNDELRNSSGLMLRKEQEELKDRLSAMEARSSEDKKEYTRKLENMKTACLQKIKEASDRADEIENRCARDNAAAAAARKEAEDFRSEQQRLLRMEQEEIDILAEQKIAELKDRYKAAKEQELSNIREKCRNADEKYRKYYSTRYAAHESSHLLIFVFCTLWLIILAATSVYFHQDLLEVGSCVMDYFKITAPKIGEVSLSAASVSDLITNETASEAIFWLVRILVAVLMGALLYAAPLAVIGIGSYKYLKSRYFDRANRWIMVGSGILVIAVSSQLTARLPVNLVLLWLVIQVIVPVVRGIASHAIRRTDARGYY